MSEATVDEMKEKEEMREIEKKLQEMPRMKKEGVERGKRRNTIL